MTGSPELLRLQRRSQACRQGAQTHTDQQAPISSKNSLRRRGFIPGARHLILGHRGPGEVAAALLLELASEHLLYLRHEEDTHSRAGDAGKWRQNFFIDTFILTTQLWNVRFIFCVISVFSPAATQ